MGFDDNVVLTEDGITDTEETFTGEIWKKGEIN